jgi:hypothetical protein
MTRERGDLDAVPPDANASPYPLIARQGIGKGVPKRFLTTIARPERGMSFRTLRGCGPAWLPASIAACERSMGSREILVIAQKISNFHLVPFPIENCLDQSPSWMPAWVARVGRGSLKSRRRCRRPERLATEDG